MLRFNVSQRLMTIKTEKKKRYVQLKFWNNTRVFGENDGFFRPTRVQTFLLKKIIIKQTAIIVE